MSMKNFIRFVVERSLGKKLSAENQKKAEDAGVNYKEASMAATSVMKEDKTATTTPQRKAVRDNAFDEYIKKNRKKQKTQTVLDQSPADTFG